MTPLREPWHCSNPACSVGNVEIENPAGSAYLCPSCDEPLTRFTRSAAADDGVYDVLRYLTPQ